MEGKSDEVKRVGRFTVNGFKEITGKRKTTPLSSRSGFSFIRQPRFDFSKVHFLEKPLLQPPVLSQSVWQIPSPL